MRYFRLCYGFSMLVVVDRMLVREELRKMQDVWGEAPSRQRLSRRFVYHRPAQGGAPVCVQVSWGAIPPVPYSLAIDKGYP